MNDPAVESEQAIVVLTDTFRIEGKLGIFSGVRLTDYMNEAKAYVPITDAVVKDLCGRRMFKAAFLNLKQAAIQMIIPAGEIAED